jgi:hypothetical protein
MWFVRDKEHIWDSNNGNYTVWFSQGLADAPEVKSTQVITTPTPRVTITPLDETQQPTLEALTATPIVQFTITPLEEGPFGLGKPNYNEMDYLGMIGVTLIPSVLFVVLVVIAVSFFRRRD